MSNAVYIGQGLTRSDAPLKVTGRAKFGSDHDKNDMLFGRVLRSPYPHAKILDIDTSAAERLPGVKGVVTGKPLVKPVGMFLQDEPLLATDRVRYRGEGVAAVGAVSEDIAEDALSLIRVEYEELPAVFDPESAMAEDAPRVHEDKENAIDRFRVTFGDVERGFQDADVIVENRYTTGRVAHLALEPRSTLATYDLGGKLTVEKSSQSVYGERALLSEALGIPQSKIRVVSSFVGGAFGSKEEPLALDAGATLLAMKTGRPVKVTHTREDEFHTRLRHPFIIQSRHGAKKDGSLTAVHYKVIIDNGAYTSLGTAVSRAASTLGGSLYRLPHYLAESVLVYTHHPPCGAMRGFGNPQITFAQEQQMDLLAAELGLDPVEIRLRNAVETGDETASGAILKSCGLKECIQKAAERFGWAEKRKNPKPNRGIGVACGVHFTSSRETALDCSAVTLKMNLDGSLILIAGTSEMGTGSDSLLGQIAAEILGIPPEEIEIIRGDTETTPFCLGIWGSRVTTMAGKATQMAAEEVRGLVAETVAEKLEVGPDDLMFRDKRVFVPGSPGQGVDLADAVMSTVLRRHGQELITKAQYDAVSECLDEETGRGNYSQAWSFTAKIVEVEVNPETGLVEVQRLISSVDLGKAINPKGAEGQIEGSAQMGLGFALSEECVWENGLPVNATMVDYKMPASIDMPPVDAILVESNDPYGPFGAKGLGEMALVGVAAAVSNAVHDATGVRIKDAPITSEKVYFGLRNLQVD
jgi:CO/xanthine dehydrogenase Mo-binding subunit